jgi:hypothetical protein
LDQIEEDEMDRWRVASMGVLRNAYKILVGWLEGKRPFGGPRYRWEGNIDMDLREMVFEGWDWFHLAQDSDWWQAV